MARSPSPGRIGVLEGLRGLAALYVFVGHLGLETFGLRNGRGALFFQFGQEAVIVFFILSGFVINYSVESRPGMGFGEYLTRRASRIYPIFLISLLLTGLAMRNPPFPWSNVFMLQDFASAKPGVWFSTFGTNSALWSLSYEWWFYLLYFPIQRVFPPARQKWMAVGVSFLGLITYFILPNQISLFALYFSIWWSGVELSRLYLESRRPTLANQTTSIVTLCVPLTCFLIQAVLLRARGQHLSLGFHPLLEARHFGAAILLLAGASTLSGQALSIVKAALGPFAVLAPISYALYVLHMPLVVHASYLEGVVPKAAAIVVYSAILFLAAWLAEIPLQKLINRLSLRRWSKPSGAPAKRKLSMEAVPEEA